MDNTERVEKNFSFREKGLVHKIARVRFIGRDDPGKKPNCGMDSWIKGTYLSNQ